MPPKSKDKMKVTTRSTADDFEEQDLSTIPAGVAVAIQNLTDQLEKMNDSIGKMGTEIKDIRVELTSINSVKDSLSFTQDGLKSSQEEIKNIQMNMKDMKYQHELISQQLTECKKQNADLHEKLLQLETYSRRENLVFSAIPEDTETGNSPLNKVRDIFVNTLKITEGKTMDIQRCHRIGYKSGKRGRPRDIIVRFVRFPDREQIWAARNKLKNTDIIMKEDFPQEIDQRRAKLFPIQKAARAENKKAYMVVDKLFIDGRKYTIDNLNTLPK